MVGVGTSIFRGPRPLSGLTPYATCYTLNCDEPVRGSSPLGSTTGQRPFPTPGEGLFRARTAKHGKGQDARRLLPRAPAAQATAAAKAVNRSPDSG